MNNSFFYELIIIILNFFIYKKKVIKKNSKIKYVCKIIVIYFNFDKFCIKHQYRSCIIQQSYKQFLI